MSTQYAPGTRPQVRKAMQLHDETCEPAQPNIVTELLAAFLLPLGRAVEVSQIVMNTRDEVLTSGKGIPWRRSPMWLLMKIALRRVAALSTESPEEELSAYKHFMVFFMSRILSEASGHLRMSSECPKWCDYVFCMKAKIIRRLHKLQRPLSPRLSQEVYKSLSKADAMLRSEWSDIQQHETVSTQIDPVSVAQLDFAVKTVYDLPLLDVY